MEDPRKVPEIPAKPNVPETNPTPDTPETPQVPTQPVTVPGKQPVPSDPPTRIPPKELLAYARMMHEHYGYDMHAVI